MDRLLREGDPPSGQIASPKPQYKKAGSDPIEYEPVEGQHGAPFAMLVDANGNPIIPASAEDIAALETELGLVKSELAAVKAMLTDGTAKGQVTLSGNMVTQLAPRAIRTSKYLFPTTEIPAWCRGMHVQVYIRGVTGSFESGQGLSLITRPVIREAGIANIELASPRLVKFTAFDQFWVNGGNKGEAMFARGGIQVAGIMGGNRLSGELAISGTFGEGEGIDCEAWAIFMI